MNNASTNTSQEVAETDVPIGFTRSELGPGYGAAFGPVYRHQSEPKMGFRVAPHHANPVNVCHGGAMSTFADMLVAAVHCGAGSGGDHAPTITLSVDFLAPAAVGSWVEGDVALLKSTGTMLFVQALITADGELVARANGIYRRYRQAGSENA